MKRQRQYVVAVFLFDRSAEIRQRLHDYFFKHIKPHIFCEVNLRKPKNVAEILKQTGRLCECYIVANNNMEETQREELNRFQLDNCSRMVITTIYANLESSPAM